tara:strand:- start:3645 stop:4688 length:1044 start_codon:yes stop_codon:yes gene_type:complete
MNNCPEQIKKFDKFVAYVPPGQFRLLSKQNRKKSYSVRKPGDDFTLLRKIKRKFIRTPHTNTYFFEGFYKAAKFLNLNAYWIDNQEDLENVVDDKTIVLCEGSYFPDLNKKLNCKYVLHSIPSNWTERYSELSARKQCLHLDLFKNKALKHSKIDELTYFDEKEFTLYQPWAGNLMPSEIVDIDYLKNIDYKYSYYIGLLYGDGSHKAKALNHSLSSSKKRTQIKCVTGASHFTTQELTLKSSICLDIRYDHHLEIGYVPCRIFKTLSFGREIYVNSKYIKDYLKNIPFVKYYKNEECLKNQYDKFCSMNASIREVFYKEKMLTLNKIKEKHTFVNRLNNILRVFSE